MADYFNAGMRLYLDHLVDWKALLEIRSGGAVDVDAEVAHTGRSSRPQARWLPALKRKRARTGRPWPS